MSHGESAHPGSCTCRAHPLPATMTVRAARDAYLAENGFTVEAYDDRWTKASLFGLPLAVPNTRRHRWAIMLHDLHHVATGFGTDSPGEAEISAWEARGGLSALGPYVASIVIAGASLGLAIAPLRTVRAFRRARDARSLFTPTSDYERLLDMTVGELRAMLGVPRRGLARRERRLHPDAPRPATA